MTDDEQIVKDLCISNGINYEKLVEEGCGGKMQELEMFFFGYPRIVGMEYFPNLTKLSIVNQKINSMKGVEVCTNLTELWVCEGQLTKIEGLQNCLRLLKLYLYSNNISIIEGLAAVSKLEILWLNNNRISTIENINHLTCLVDLNLAGNRLEVISSSLKNCDLLHSLNLSGNPITSLKDVTNLMHLSNLRQLSLCDSMYAPSPVALLCNYSTHVIYHLPRLQRLDGHLIDHPELQKVVQSVVSQKKMYYSVRVHAVQQRAKGDCRMVRDKMSNQRTALLSRIRRLHHCLKWLQHAKMARANSDHKMTVIRERVTKLTAKCESLDQQVGRSCDAIVSRMAHMTHRLEVELESGGNLRYELGTPSIGWYNSCIDLVNSRLSSFDLLQKGGPEVVVANVVRVENRMLHYKFDCCLEDKLSRQPYCDTATSKNGYKQYLDYLFLVLNDQKLLQPITEDGLVAMHPPAPLILTNSIAIADKNLSPAHNEAELLLCKVFVGRSKEYQQLPKRLSGDIDSGYCFMKTPPLSGLTENKPKTYLVANHMLVLPEYIVTIEYKKKKQEEWSSDHVDVGSCDNDDDVMAMSPVEQPRPRLALLTETAILEVSGQSSLTDIKTLNLHGNSLTRFIHMGTQLAHLNTLVLCFNELSQLDEVSHLPNLEYLDVSFNSLTTLEGLRSLPRLKHLDVSWNELTCYRDAIGVMRRHTPAIQVLHIENNPWNKCGNLRCYFIGRLKSLQELDGKRVSDDEAQQSLRYTITAHLSLTTLISHVRMDQSQPRSLSLQSISHIIGQNSGRRPVQLTSTGADWCEEATCVCVNNQSLTQLSSISKLPNLRWASFANNLLHKTEGLEQCVHLEELILNNNLIKKIEGFHNLKKLCHLAVASNLITSIADCGLNNMPHLQFLDVSDNLISSMEGLRHCNNLQLLYASNNKISDCRELLSLKMLNQLAVVDLHGNPVSTTTNYRLYMVYHVSSLKALDGAVISSSEVAEARDWLAGRLTEDFVFEQLGNHCYDNLHQLDCPHLGIKVVDLSPPTKFNALLSINLEHNCLTSFSGLAYLPSLKVLCLNHNRVECFSKQGRHSADGWLNSLSSSSASSSLMLYNLEVLHLAYNGISSLPPLELWRFPSLKALFLQGNELSQVEGLKGVQQLMELVLDRNKIKSLLPSSFTTQSLLRELHMEENRLRDLSYFQCLRNLERLYLGMNRIQDVCELDQLEELSQLKELSLLSNPVSRRVHYRTTVIGRLPQLASLDGVEITSDERAKVEAAMWNEQHQGQYSESSHPLPGILHTPQGSLNVSHVPIAADRSQQGQKHFMLAAMSSMEEQSQSQRIRLTRDRRGRK